MSNSCLDIRPLLSGVLLLAVVTACAQDPLPKANPNAQRQSRAKSTAAAEVMAQAQRDNAVYQSQRKLDRQTNTAAANGAGRAVFKGHITAVKLSASGAPLIHISGSNSPWLNRRQTAMVHVFRGDKPVGVYPMNVIRQGEQTILGPLGSGIDVRQGDSISIAPAAGSTQ
jgi:hypothetical protein